MVGKKERAPKDYGSNKRVWGWTFVAFLSVNILLRVLGTGSLISELGVIISGIMWAVNAVKARRR